MVTFGLVLLAIVLFFTGVGIGCGGRSEEEVRNKGFEAGYNLGWKQARQETAPKKARCVCGPKGLYICKNCKGAAAIRRKWWIVISPDGEVKYSDGTEEDAKQISTNWESHNTGTKYEVVQVVELIKETQND